MILSGWESASVGEIAAVRTGPFGSALHESDYRRVGTPIVTVEHLGDRGLVHRNLPLVGDEDTKRLSAYVCRTGDILFSRVGSVDRNSLVSSLEDGWLYSGRLLRLRVDPRRVHAPFLSHLFSTSRFKASVRSVAVGQTMPSLNTRIVKSLIVSIPDVATQREIAQKLAAIDSLIAALEHLVTKKQAIKQGMMQQLLTGRTRLAGFSAAWETVTLGDLGTFLKGRGVKRADVRATGVPCIRYGELYTNFMNYTATTNSFVSLEVAHTAQPIRSGDLLFAGSGETREEIGVCVAYVGGARAVAGGDIVVLRGRSFNPVYLATLVNTPAVVSQKARAGQGDAVVHINSRALAAIAVSIPQRAEQDAIAEVLMDADRELNVLRARLSKARGIKQGMMQELLTGRTRLPDEAAS